MNRNSIKILSMICLIPILTVVSCASDSVQDSEPTTSQNESERAANQISDEDQIRDAFFAYRDSLLSSSGTGAWELVDSHTRQYYQEIVEYALELDREGLSRLDFISRFTVLRLRHEFGHDELNRLDGESLFVESVERGWISFASVSALGSLENVTVDGNYGAAYLPDLPDFPFMRFIRESDEWKLALTHNFELANESFAAMAQQHGMSEDELVVALITQLSNFEFNQAIFDGPVD